MYDQQSVDPTGVAQRIVGGNEVKRSGLQNLIPKHLPREPIHWDSDDETNWRMTLLDLGEDACD